MQKVAGIGGVFFKSKDPEALREWYLTYLGIDSPYGSATFEWRDARDGRPASTIWSPFKAETKYFEPSQSSFMINYRVDDLEALLAQLRAAGLEADGIEDSEYGRFGWVMDPEGNRLELWQDVAPVPKSAAIGVPAVDEYANWYAGYVAKVGDDPVLEVLRSEPAQLRELLGGVDAEKARFRYAPGKWSIAEVVGHMIDAERVFGHRLFCISRGETQALPGFDEGTYVAAAGYDARPLPDLIEEFALVRRGNLAVIDGLSEAHWSRTGVASGHPVSVRALAYIAAGHARHHMSVLRERYGL